MLYVHVHVTALGHTMIVAVPKNVVSYVAEWDGNNWIAKGLFSAATLLCLDNSFVISR